MPKPKKSRNRTLHRERAEPKVLDEAAHARVVAYLARTQETFRQILRPADGLGPAGRGVLAGPLAPRRSRSAPDEGERED